MDQLAHVEYPEVFDKAPEATHVVTRIEYGADAVFKLTKGTNSIKERQDIQGKLEVAVTLHFGNNTSCNDPLHDSAHVPLLGPAPQWAPAPQQPKK